MLAMGEDTRVVRGGARRCKAVVVHGSVLMSGQGIPSIG